MSLSIQHEETAPGSVVIKLAGRLLLGPDCQELQQLIAAEIARGARHLTFDLSEVSHVDSTGMGRFIDAYGKLHALAGSVHVRGARGAVRDMFRVTKLDTFLQFD